MVSGRLQLVRMKWPECADCDTRQVGSTASWPVCRYAHTRPDGTDKDGVWGGRTTSACAAFGGVLARRPGPQRPDLEERAGDNQVPRRAGVDVRPDRRWRAHPGEQADRRVRRELRTAQPGAGDEEGCGREDAGPDDERRVLGDAARLADRAGRPGTAPRASPPPTSNPHSAAGQLRRQVVAPALSRPRSPASTTYGFVLD